MTPTALSMTITLTPDRITLTLATGTL